MAALLAAGTLLAALAACGQKGALYLPDNRPAPTPAASSATTNPSTAQP